MVSRFAVFRSPSFILSQPVCPTVCLHQQVVTEMNRLGMLIDLAHVPVEVMHQVLDMSKAPVIFSHSSAYDKCKHKRNVPNEVIKKVVSAWAFFFLVSLGNFSLE